jgi:hypothetical protein
LKNILIALALLMLASQAGVAESQKPVQITFVDPAPYTQETWKRTAGVDILVLPYIGSLQVDGLGYPKREWHYGTGLSYTWFFGSPDKHQIEEAVGSIMGTTDPQEIREIARKKLNPTLTYLTIGGIGLIVIPIYPYIDAGFMWQHNDYDIPYYVFPFGYQSFRSENVRFKLGVMAFPSTYNTVRIYPTVGAGMTW